MKRLTRAEIEKKTEALLQEHQVTDYPIPVERIAVAIGIQIARSAADWNQSGFLLRDTNRTILGINSRNAPVRQRFTIAHELGHYKLHDLPEQRLFVDQSAAIINHRDERASTGTDNQEVEANAFAAALLMPKEMMKQAAKDALNRNPGTRDDFISDLAKRFDVSVEAMSIRLSNLGILRN